MYLYKPSGEALRCEGRFGYDGTNYHVMPMLEKRDSSLPFECYFPAGMMYGIAKDSGWLNKRPVIPDFQHMANSRRNTTFSVSISSNKTITGNTNCQYFNLYHSGDLMAGFAPSTALYGSDILVKEYPGQGSMSSMGILRENGPAGNVSTYSTSKFAPSFSFLQYVSNCGSRPNRRSAYTFAIVINGVDVGFGANYDPISVCVPFANIDYSYQYADFEFANPRGFLGDDVSYYTPNTTYYRGFWDGTTSDSAFQFFKIDILHKQVLIHGSIYLEPQAFCTSGGYGAFGTPWIVFDRSKLMFDSGKTSGTLNLEICETIEGYCGWSIT